MARMFLSVIVICALSCTNAALAGDQKTYEFRQRYLDGQTYNVLFTQQLQLEVQRTLNGQVVDRPKVVHAIQQKGLITVLETINGIPMQQQITVDKSSGEFFQTSGEQPSQENVKFAGKTIHTQHAGDDTLYTVDGVEGPRETPDLTVWLSRDTEIYPNVPVHIGEKWDLSKKTAYLRILDQDQSVVAFGMLKSIKMIHGRPFAEVIVSVAMEGTFRRQKGLHLEIQAEGPALVDLQSGRIAKMDLNGDVQCTGAVNVPIIGTGRTVHLNVTGGGSIEFHQISVAAKPQPRIDVAT